MKQRVVLIGSGAVAERLAVGLSAHPRYVIVQIYGRSLKRPTVLRQMLADSSVECITDLGQVDVRADLYIFSVTDDALPAVWSAMPVTEGVWLHTAGSVPLSAMSAYHDRVGVLYPLQTFTRGVTVDWTQIPIYVEGADEYSLERAQSLAEALSPRVYLADSTQRVALHLAAVLACNFTNHLWTLAGQVLEQHQLPQDSLHALVAETLRKAKELGPAAAQTGPARRADAATIDRHLALLHDMPELERIYRQLSESIMTLYNR